VISRRIIWLPGWQNTLTYHRPMIYRLGTQRSGGPSGT